jgi:hypothetical protein
VEGFFVSIVRVGLAETKNFAEGYDAIFGGKPASKKKPGKNTKKATGKAKNSPSKAAKNKKKK